MTRALLQFFRKNPLITAVFIASLAFWIYQHAYGFSWDFAVYSLNGRYLLHDGSFFEWSRPPLAPTLMAVLGFAGMVAAEYLYIIFVAALFLYACVRFCRAARIDVTAYYVFALQAPAVLLGMKDGTELLSLALLQLFLAELHARRSGLLFGLSLMARYANIVYLPLLFLRKKRAAAAVALLLAGVTLVPWLAYNTALTGNALSSFIDFYLINVRFREPNVSFSPLDFALMAGIVLPFFAYGVWKTRKKKDKNRSIILAFCALAVLGYMLTSIKYVRFLFPLIMPLAYFAAQAVKKRTVLVAFFLINAALVIAAAALIPEAALPEGSYHYRLAAHEPCKSISNVWVALHYYGSSAEPTVSNVVQGHMIETDVNKSLSEGYRIVLFKYASEPSYVKNLTFLRQFPVREENDVFIVLGNECNAPAPVAATFLERLRKEAAAHGYRLA